MPKLLLAILLLQPLAADIIYVNPDASPPRDGTSWGSGYSSLQQAILQAQDEDEIYVTEGIYYPDDVNSVPNSNSRA